MILNCTPHPIRFLDGGAVHEVGPSGFTLKADVIEQPAGERDGCELVHITFVPSEEGERELAEIEAQGLMPVGSIISAQAWPGRVFALVPVKGLERAAKKLFRSDKFTVY